MSWRATLITSSCVMMASALLLVPISSAQVDRQGPIFAITEENDLFSNPLSADHTDRHYTQGLKFTYLGGDNDVPGWAAAVGQALPRWAIQTNAENL
ncbi:MAG TPA: lipid A-modifier LpxR family protein, partial [Verrucomicrobiae bacterium]|nr:lipid A-modifier LpxR family protein [Verrucomicrobiae bacterium]